MVVTREGFTKVVANALAGYGFAPESPSVFEFPSEMFLQSSDLSPINEHIDKIVFGLTEWEPKTRDTGIFYPGEKVKVEGADSLEAVDNFHKVFLKNMWGDGLPLVPPTQELVDWILTGTDLDKDAVIGAGKIKPRGGIATTESLAIALAMAGGRPEYLPVLIAVVEAVTQDQFGLDAFNATTANPYFAVIVSGPIAKDIRLSSTYGCLGPDAVYPAGSVIGRSLSLVMRNLGGALPGNGSMAIYGEMRATNAVFAEDEEGLPEGWPSLSEQRGRELGTNMVTVCPVSSATNVNLTSVDARDAEGAAKQYMYRIAGTMRAPGGQLFRQNFANADMATGVVLMGRTWALALTEQGMSKLDIQTKLWEDAHIPWDELVKMGNANRAQEKTGIQEGEAAPLWAKPEQLLLVVAGGDQAGHAFWMAPGGTSGYTTVDATIELPGSWDDLIEQAEQDLGPAPVK